MQKHIAITVRVDTIDQITVTKGSTEFVLMQAVDGSWMVDFYKPRVKTPSSDYSNLMHYCKEYADKVQYDYMKPGSQIWITGDLYYILHLLTLNCVKEEWSQYYKEVNNA
jgi:hypothetical protein